MDRDGNAERGCTEWVRTLGLNGGKLPERIAARGPAEVELFRMHGAVGLFTAHKLRELAGLRRWSAVPFRTDAERRAVADWAWSTPSRLRTIVETMARAGMADPDLWEDGLIRLSGMEMMRNGRK